MTRPQQNPIPTESSRGSGRKKRGAGRAEILRCALIEFSTKGYTGATTAGIAKAAGLTQPLVHHHFSSKEQLWQAVLDQLHKDYENTMVGVIETAKGLTIVEQLRTRLKAFVRFTASHSEFSRIVVFESARGGSTYDYLFEKYLGPEFEVLKKLLGRAKDAGLIGDIDLDLLLFIVSGASTHLFVVPETVRRAIGVEPLNLETADRYADLVANILIKGMSKD